MTVCYNFASRSRPEKFFAALDNIIQNATHDDYFILGVFDDDDVTMNDQAVRDRLHTYGDKVFPTWGISENKIHAINREIGQSYIPHWDIVCNHSDDMWFTEKGFDQHIINAFEGFSGLLHIPDSFVNERLCTYSIMDRAYFNKFGYIYNPEYLSVYADQEAQDVAKLLKKYKYLPISVLSHDHPVWQKCAMDEQYRKTESFYPIDGETYRRRLLRAFDLKNQN